jgi:hypothetical protein
MKTAIVPKIPFEEIHGNAMREWVSSADIKTINKEVKEFGSNIDDFKYALSKNKIDEQSVNLYADVYANALKLSNYFSGIVDSVKNLVLQTGSLTSEKRGVVLSREGGKVKSTSYDLDRMKSEQPKLYKTVTYRLNKKLLKKDRLALEKQIAQKKEELKKLNAILAEDNANQKTYVDEKAFERIAETNPEILQYRNQELSGYRFAVREDK